MSTGSDRQELATLVMSFRRHIQRQERVGIRFLSRDEAPQANSITVTNENLLSGTEGDLFSDSSETDTTKTLEELRATIGDCRRCKLWSGRTHLVFGVGNPKARLMFIGEGPGRDEDLQGEPFVGRAGQLLTDIITKGMGLKREDVYIANVVKCPPPEIAILSLMRSHPASRSSRSRSISFGPKILSPWVNLLFRRCCRAKFQLQNCGAIGIAIMESN